MKTFYRFQYNDGALSMIINDDKKMMYECARILSTNKNKYPVCIWTVKLKIEQE